MAERSWTWNSQEHPEVAAALAAPAVDLEWCDQLESAPSDMVVGKVLCVCAASSIARLVLDGQGGDVSQASDSLKLLDCWIDEPTDERFDRICEVIFEEDWPESAAIKVAWWALRTATSAVGCGEAGWALGGACDNALKTGLTPEQLRAVAEQAVASRARPVDREAEDFPDLSHERKAI